MAKKNQPMNSKRRIKAMENNMDPANGKGKKNKGDANHIELCRSNKSSVHKDRKKEADKKKCRENNLDD